MRDVAVLGVGCTKVGEHWERSLRDLFVEASLKALEDSGVEEVDALYVSNMASGFLQRQEHLGAVMADALGMSPIPAMRVEAASASGGVAFHEALKAVASGMNDFVLVGGVEKMTDCLPPEVVSTLIMSEDQEYTAYTGVTYVGLCAILKRLYMERFGVKPEEIAMISVVGHENAASNPYAQYPFKTSIERVMSS
ncbi:MAG: beta-ketoacyl synthase N-terminal-like domain-containing protein, partial [Candidatus Bathyarchaeia archaeon]